MSDTERYRYRQAIPGGRPRIMTSVSWAVKHEMQRLADEAGLTLSAYTGKVLGDHVGCEP